MFRNRLPQTSPRHSAKSKKNLTLRNTCWGLPRQGNLGCGREQLVHRLFIISLRESHVCKNHVAVAQHPLREGVFFELNHGSEMLKGVPEPSRGSPGTPCAAAATEVDGNA